jgi:GNAT superfamily N-acetyltransferase
MGGHRKDRAGISNNWSEIEKAHHTGQLRVVRCEGKAIAFHTHAERLQPASLLAVQLRHQKRGIASAMVRSMVEWASANGVDQLAIDDWAPGFWKKVGFRHLVSERGIPSRYAYLAVPKPPDHPQGRHHPAADT